jgi:hypothetical protein
MRIPVREQLSLLVLLVSLIALMVLALAVVRVNFSQGWNDFCLCITVVPKSQLHHWRRVRRCALAICFVDKA